MKKKILVLGGGISGLSVAWQLAEINYDVELIEAKDHLGGLAATVKVDQYSLDFGPHFFVNDNQELNTKLSKLFPNNNDLLVFKRNAQLLLNGRHLNYPLTMRNVLTQMGFYTAFMSGMSYLKSKSLEKFKNIPEEDMTFEDWAIQSFGYYLYKIFFKPYTEQFWGVHCSKLSPRSIPTHTKLTFFKTLKLLFVKEIIKSNLSLVERETILPLRYPKIGIGELSSRIAKDILYHNGQINTGWKITYVEKKPNKTFLVKAIKDGKERAFEGDYLVSTIPLTEFTKILHPSPPEAVLESSNNLGFLSLIVLYLVTENKSLLDSSYLYQVGRPYNRMSEIKKFCDTLCPQDENMLAIELTTNGSDPKWNYTSDELFELCIKSLEKDGILNRKDVKKVHVLKAPFAYPIYLHNYKHNLNNVLKYMDELGNVDVLGRSGKYMYMDMDQCMLKACELVHNISRKMQ